VIGDVYPDPDSIPQFAKDQQWLADIAEYEPFSSPVPIRQSDGTYSELLTRTAAKNWWGIGVRRISSAAFEKLLKWGGLGVSEQKAENESGPAQTVDPGQLWKRRTAREQKGARRFFKRESKRAKIIGDEAERIVLAHLHNQEPNPVKKKQIRWVANDGETPGYDILDGRGEIQRGYEVKGTTGSQFLSIDLTQNEMRCAREMGSGFVLVLVTGVFTKSPKIAFMHDPVRRIAAGDLSVTPVVFRLDFAAEASEVKAAA
jgi:hypothetical protein